MKTLPLILAAGSLFAQTRLTPGDAVTMALQRNAALDAAASRIASAEGLRLQAGLKPNPRLILQNENSRIPVGGPLQFARDTDTFVMASQVFERGDKREFRQELASENVRASEISREYQRAQLTARVLQAYWNAVGAARLVTEYRDTLAVLAQTVEYHRNRVKEGSLPEADLIRVDLEYQQVDLSRKNAEQDAKRALFALYREIGVPEDTTVELTGDLAAITPLPVTDIDQAIERRPDVKLALQAVQQARAGIRLQRAIAVPDPELLVGYKRTAGFNTLVAGVQLNLPVRNKNQGAIEASVADESAAAASLRALRTSAKTEIEALRTEYEQKRDLIDHVLPSMRSQASETRRIADAVYREGASDLLRLLDAERVRIQTESLYIRTLIDYRQAAIGLQATLGLLP